MACFTGGAFWNRTLPEIWGGELGAPPIVPPPLASPPEAFVVGSVTLVSPLAVFGDLPNMFSVIHPAPITSTPTKMPGTNLPPLFAPERVDYMAREDGVARASSAPDAPPELRVRGQDGQAASAEDVKNIVQLLAAQLR